MREDQRKVEKDFFSFTKLGELWSEHVWNLLSLFDTYFQLQWLTIPFVMQRYLDLQTPTQIWMHQYIDAQY